MSSAPSCKNTPSEFLHRCRALFDSGTRNPIVHPISRNSDANATSPLVIKALPGERASKICLDRSKLCMKSIEQRFVACGDESIGVQLDSGLVLEYQVVPPLSMSPCAKPVVSTGRNPEMKFGLLIDVGQKPSPEDQPCIVPARALFDLRQPPLPDRQWARGLEASHLQDRGGTGSTPTRQAEHTTLAFPTALPVQTRRSA